MRTFAVLCSLAVAAGLATSANAAVNYNASKSNTGNIAVADTHHGLSVGRRRHHPLAHNLKKNPPIDHGSGVSTGRRQH